MSKRRFLVAAVAACAGPLALCQGWTAEPPYPSRALHFAVNFPPGGASDLMARIFGQKLGEVLGQSVIVENRVGASGAIGAVYAAHQPPDGYTFMLGSLGSTIVAPIMNKALPYDMARDFSPVALIATGPGVFVVSSRSPYNSLQELLAAARSKPGALNFGSGGRGTFSHLAGEMLNAEAGVQIQHVPYKGSVQALNDVIAGQVDMLAADPPAVLPHIKAGKVRALAVSSTAREVLLPEVPTFVESGLPGLVALNSWSIYMPTGVPPAVAQVFHAALDKAMADPDLVKKFAELGADVQHSTPEELRRFTAAETAKYTRLIKEKDIKGE